MPYNWQHHGSYANLRPCSGPHGVVATTEVRCEAMRVVPAAGKFGHTTVRCTHGICQAHDSMLGGPDFHYDHICPQCFEREIARMSGKPYFGW